jgi:nucleoside phosphorylase
LAKNDSGGTIAKGRGVMFAGVVGGSGKLEYTNAVSNGTVDHDYAMGIAGQTVANGDFGYVIEFGSLKGIDTTGADKTVPETWLVGDFLYFDSAYPGELTNVEPIAPAWHSPIAVVTSVNATAGSLFVRVKTGERLGELHDVRINGTGAADGQVLRYDGTDERWENVLLTTGEVVGTTDTQTLTDKRINPRAVTASGTSGSLTPNGDTTDVYVAEGLTGAITLAQPSGTPVDGQKLLIRLEDDGTARAITWTTSAGAFREVGITLPTTTVATKITYVGCVYNGTDSFWDAIATVTQA